MTPGALLVALALAAQADGRPSEADMFGGDSTTVTEPPPSPGGVPPAGSTEAGREDDIFGGSSVEVATGDALMPQALTDALDSFDVGGLLFLRADATIADEQPIYEATLSSRNLLDVYLDARPTDRVRAFASFRVGFDPTVQDGATDTFGRVQEQLSFDLDQLWLKGDISRLAFVTVGRQHIKWGASRFWNPTDFMNQQVRDPLDVFDRRLGVDLVKLHVPFEDWGANTYFLASLDDATQPWKVGGAARAEVAFGTTEVTASTAFRDGQSFKVGGDVSTGIWLFDLRAEGALQHGVRTPVYVGRFDIDSLTFPTAIDVRDEWAFQGVLGGDVTIPYSEQDNLIVGAEYFYNQLGYDDADLYPWLLFNGAYTPLYVGHHYAAAYAVLFAPGSWNDASFTGSAITNISDGSYLLRLDTSLTVLTKVTLNAYGASHIGNEGGELRFGLEVPPVPFVAGLEDGLVIPTPAFDVGLGARVAF
jgi:hypothetical protein